MAGISVFIFVALLTGSHSITWDLNENWRVKGSDPGIDVPATVPGGIYSDLMDNGVIPDVLYGSGDTEFRWVGLQDWTYYSNFTVDREAFSKKFVNLVFDGLDTFATILVNGVQVGTTQNMFVQYIYPVKEILQEGSNTIEVIFQSSVNVSASLAANGQYPDLPDCPGDESNGECHVNQIRKMQASYSWDWGPAFPSVGIWKPVTIEAFNTAVIRYVTVNHFNQHNGSWLVTVDTYFDAGTNDRVEGYLMSTLYTRHYYYTYDHINVTFNENHELVARSYYRVDYADIIMWWPNGYGSQNIVYKMNVLFPAERPESTKTMKIGFRTIELVQEDVGGGKTFYFSINNGVPIFAKGANEIPVAILPERGQDPKRVTELLESAAEANMNMLRVWGGGVYESDFFYEEADRLGIMIWQDMMFASAYYPAYPEYLDNVKQEVHHQVLRLQHHPSVVLFGGNNENEMVLYADFLGNFTFYRGEYIKLFVDVVGAEIERLAPSTFFVSSSPANGVANEGDDILTSDPSSTDFGDVHYYNYGSDGWDYKTFPVPRFASEFGYQSMPSVDAWLTATNNTDDLNPDGDFVNHRQHHPGGAIQNSNLINIQLQLPENDNTSDYAATFIYYSQIVQAMSYKTEVEHYRSYAKRLDEDGKGFTMGALFWQLNDVWVAPTWSSIDHTGSWKMAQYFAKNFYSTNLVTAKLIEGQLKIYVVMDKVVYDAPKIRLHVMPYAKYEPAYTQNITKFDIKSYTAVEAASIDAAALLIDSGCGADFAEASTNCFFHFHLLDPDDNMIAPANWLFPAKLKDSNLVQPTVEISSVTPLDDDGLQFGVTVTSDTTALFVWLEAHGIPGRFSDNGLIIVSPTTTVNFTSKAETSLDELQSVLTITHL